ncbi:MAG: hypothetical protein FWG63_06275 [Defluviitaleaceae bacterium]|nr:hypothetical protein [Defluviitaleaceae bacterium]
MTVFFNRAVLFTILLVTVIVGYSGQKIAFAAPFAEQKQHFFNEITIRRNNAIQIAEAWLYEKRGLSLEQVVVEASLIFQHTTPLWSVIFKDFYNEIFEQINIDHYTGEIREEITHVSSVGWMLAEGTITAVTQREAHLVEADEVIELRLNYSNPSIGWITTVPISATLQPRTYFIGDASVSMQVGDAVAFSFARHLNNFVRVGVTNNDTLTGVVWGSLNGVICIPSAGEWRFIMQNIDTSDVTWNITGQVAFGTVEMQYKEIYG